MNRAQPRPTRSAIDASMRAQAPAGSSVRIDLWIARRLGRPDLYSGITTPTGRMERQRHEIETQGLREIRVVGASTETWGALFERVHGEVL